MKRLLIGFGWCLALGCHRAAAPALPSPIGLDVMRAAPELKILRFSTLLDFEADVDAAFVVASGGAKLVESGEAHSGKRALVPSSAAKEIMVRLDSLLGSRPFPSSWHLVGAYVNAARDGRLEIELLRGGQLLRKSVVTLPAGRWTAAMVDITDLPAGSGPLSLRFARDEARPPLRIDDVMLIDNTQTVLDGGAGAALTPLTLRQRGLRLIAEIPGRFSVALDTLQASPAGWEPVETNALRLRFAGGGTTRELVVYASGASYWDGRFEPLGEPQPPRAAAHASPARVLVREEDGRLVRTDPGDANNDGYAEKRGAYVIQASAARLTATLTPTVPLVQPAIEIRGLPPGDALVTLDGRAIAMHTRLPDGTLLIDLPLRIEKAVELYVAVRDP